jgi:hypothetical protein
MSGAVKSEAFDSTKIMDQVAAGNANYMLQMTQYYQAMATGIVGAIIAFIVVATGLSQAILYAAIERDTTMTAQRLKKMLLELTAVIGLFSNQIISYTVNILVGRYNIALAILSILFTILSYWVGGVAVMGKSIVGKVGSATLSVAKTVGKAGIHTVSTTKTLLSQFYRNKEMRNEDAVKTEQDVRKSFKPRGRRRFKIIQDIQVNSMCNVCNAIGDHIRQCAHCDNHHYCSIGCQSLNWNPSIAQHLVD